MCLYPTRKATQNEGTGWKAFDGTNSNLRAVFHGKDKRYPIGVWIKEEDYRSMSPLPYYGGGFHLYATKEGAELWRDVIYRKVKFREATRTGEDEGYTVIVAKEIFILPLRSRKQ